MTASPERVGKTKARAYCDTCQDGINGIGWTKAVIWCDAHNAKVHANEVRTAPEVPEGVDMSHAPENARKIEVPDA